MNIGKGKLIAASSLAALGGVAAIALGTQPETSAVEPAANAAPAKPKVKTQVVHRVRHVHAKAAPALASGESSAAPVAAAAPVEVSAPAPATAPAPAPAIAAPASEPEGDDSYEEDSGEAEDDSYEDDGGEDVDDD